LLRRRAREKASPREAGRLAWLFDRRGQSANVEVSPPAGVTADQKTTGSTEPLIGFTLESSMAT
jgi:hypothetical protein